MGTAEIHPGPGSGYPCFCTGWGALPVLLITSMGGAFSAVIESAPAIDGLAAMIVDSGIPGLLISFLICAIMMAAVGSVTTAGITATGVVLPLMGALGIAPVATTLAIDAGSILFNYMNNSGFWIIRNIYYEPLRRSSLIRFVLIAFFQRWHYVMQTFCGT